MYDSSRVEETGEGREIRELEVQGELRVAKLRSRSREKEKRVEGVFFFFFYSRKYYSKNRKRKQYFFR